MYKTLIVVDGEHVDLGEGRSDVISFEKYLREYPKLNEPKTRIINLCDTEQYLSKGYYCSLLAEARDHSVLPSVKTINGLRNMAHDSDNFAVLTNLVHGLGNSLSNSSTNNLETINKLVFFGKTDDSALDKLTAKIFALYPAPLLNLTVKLVDDKPTITITHISFSDLNEQQKQFCLTQLDDFKQTVWRINKNRKNYRWDMAILVDHNDKVPPSNKEAISRFVKAAAKYGINAEVVSIEQIKNIAHYDALFIRETTAIDHHTYRLARKAEDLGLVVMDDSASILRCCNKVYLHDAFNYKKVRSLKTEVVNDLGTETITFLEQNFDYPMILKLPEGSFSNGVFKAKTREELIAKLDELLKVSALVLVQEYMFTDFDWRIGVLNGRAIYACKYYMARGHWQIYNHSSNRFFSGSFETLPTFEVPKYVLDSALKAVSVVGNGLYGVDVKDIDNKAYVLEVNDNPSIDYKVEDAYLKDELYMQIMAEFHRRLEDRGR
ncbi:RimK family protein [Colwellia echini]|uniref:RimK family protein n=1 Tax=Colwellia echini TaxID=1982103 RepID=A0ABY3MTI7_9GAMM|nr:RimK family protein [Colwellia echini]TYK64523.1 RimK family protein [Colwellia echini]